MVSSSTKWDHVWLSVEPMKFTISHLSDADALEAWVESVVPAESVHLVLDLAKTVKTATIAEQTSSF